MYNLLFCRHVWILVSRVCRNNRFFESLQCVYCEKVIAFSWKNVRPEYPVVWLTYEEYEDKYDVGF